MSHLAVISSVLLSCRQSCCALLCFTALAVNAVSAQTIVNNSRGQHDGFMYELWSDTPNTVALTLEPAGGYRLTWQDINNFYAGKGWQHSGAKTLGYTADFPSNGTNYLSVYGWARNPVVEFYIVESWGWWRPPGNDANTFRGTVTSDGGTYDIYQVPNPPRGIDPIIYDTYWSVRQQPRSDGVVTVSNHVNAWAEAGMALGEQAFLLMAVEGYQSEGSARVEVWEAQAQATGCALCDWFGSTYPLCEQQAETWGWENGHLCVGRELCAGFAGAEVVPVACREPPKAQCYCDWYGMEVALCDNLTMGWGWENARSCVGEETCRAQVRANGDAADFVYCH